LAAAFLQLFPMNTTLPFAPPRAGRSAWFWRAWYAACRHSPLGRLRVPVERFRVARPLRAVAVVVVPALGFYYSYRRAYFNIAAAVYGVALLFALTEYGRMLGGAAFGLVVGIHAVGIAAYLNSTSPSVSFEYRLARTLVLVAAVATLLGVGLVRVCGCFILPVEGAKGTLLINVLDNGRPVKPGEVVAYFMKSPGGGQIRVDEGVYLGRVLGGAGSELKLGDAYYVLNGVSQPSLPYMPAKGLVVAGRGQFLIWPTVFQFNYKPVTRTIPEASALVDDSALVGRPYKRWFWHTQSP
jgi:hypothetical protein